MSDNIEEISKEEFKNPMIEFLSGATHYNATLNYTADQWSAKMDAWIAEEKAKEEKLKNVIKDIDGNPLAIGDTVISSTNKGVVKYKIVGETEYKWKVLYLSGDKRKDTMKVRKIDKTIDLFRI